MTRATGDHTMKDAEYDWLSPEQRKKLNRFRLERARWALSTGDSSAETLELITRLEQLEEEEG